MGITAEESELVVRRAANAELLTRSLNYADLSYACPPFLDLGAPKAPYILSADVIPQFAIGGKWLPVAIHLTPRFKARIFRNNELIGDSSLPVRTPSYMPGATIYFKSDKLNKPDAYLYKFASLSLFHHSNGQDGNSLRPDGTYNQYDGSFSTNYLEGAVYVSRKFGYSDGNDVNFTCDNGAKTHYDAYGRLGFEKHFSSDPNMVGRYGQNRLNVRAGLIRNKVYRDKLITSQKDTLYSECYTRERYRAVLTTSFITDSNLPDLGGKMNSWKRRVNAELMIARRLPVSANVAIQASAGYYGSDPYNAYFEDSYFFIRAGLAFGFFTATDYRDTPTR
ncbi:hypothetical protein BXP70_26550 [Hymenobacter crusticola]|uniref:Uncharacterized protein n=1 Tax=Hymenobacter crusticola TaxID=1770526 RepID=A0A243W5Z8_9BACT|nr:hypothetical protein BXP70_26550 [Hymenobacter crusticola]